MTDNLQSKFSDLETILNGHNDALLTLITATNTKLDSLVTALAPLSTLSASLTAMDAKLLRLQNGLTADPTLNYASAQQILLRLQNGLTADPTLNYTNAQQLLAAYTARFDQTMGLLGTNGNRPVMGLLTQLVNNLGLPTGDATTTALGLLAALVHCCDLSAPPSLPVSGDPGGCANQFASDTLVATSASYPGRSFVTWVGPLPNGAVFTTNMNLGINHAELSPEATWSGWKLFVYSKKASYYSEDPTRTGQWPTNQWRDITEAQGYPIAISVPAGDDVRAYLCPAPYTPCQQVASTAVTVNPGWGFSPRQQATPTGYPASNSTPDATYGANCVLTGNYNGYSVRLVSGNMVRIVLYWSGGGAQGAFLTPSSPGPYAISGNTSYLLFDDYDTAHQVATGAYTIEFCKPQGS